MATRNRSFVTGRLLLSALSAVVCPFATADCNTLANLCPPEEIRLGFFSKGDCALTRASFFQGHEWLTFFGNQDLSSSDRFTDGEVLIIADGNRRVDWPKELLVHMNNSIIAYADALTEYTDRPENQKLHFLLTPTNTSEEAARDSIDEIRRLTVEAVSLWVENRTRSLTLIGRANHILQDSFSHAHAVREPANGWCIRKVKAYTPRAPSYDTPDIEYHGAKQDAVGHTTSEDSIYREGRDCHEPEDRVQVEACLSEEAQRARLGTRDYLALVRRAIVAALQVARSGELSDDDTQAAIEDIVDQELDPYVAEHLSMCP
jgi:hypothetical protein